MNLLYKIAFGDGHDQFYLKRLGQKPANCTGTKSLEKPTPARTRGKPEG